MLNNISELGNIFKDLSILVVEQGTILDRIDFNMELAVSASDEGVKQLKIAESR
jgi:syntaxin 16